MGGASLVFRSPTYRMKGHLTFRMDPASSGSYHTCKLRKTRQANAHDPLFISYTSCRSLLLPDMRVKYHPPLHDHGTAYGPFSESETFGERQSHTPFSQKLSDPKPRLQSWVLPPLSNSWIINIIWLYIALDRTPNMDCYWVGAVPNLNPTTLQP